MNLRLNIGLAIFFLFGFVPTAFAAGAITDDGSLLDLAKPILDAVLNGHGWIAAAAALVFAATMARRYLAPQWPFLNGGFGAALIVLAGSFGGAVLVGLAAAGTSTLTFALAAAALKVAFVAAGGYSILKPLIVGLVEPWLIARFPFLKGVLDLITWALFDKPDATAIAVAKGIDATVAHPATGVAGITGNPTEIE